MAEEERSWSHNNQLVHSLVTMNNYSSNMTMILIYIYIDRYLLRIRRSQALWIRYISSKLNFNSSTSFQDIMSPKLLGVTIRTMNTASYSLHQLFNCLLYKPPEKYHNMPSQYLKSQMMSSDILETCHNVGQGKAVNPHI